MVFLLFFSLNFFIWGRCSSGAAPFGTSCALIAMWFCISVPLVFLGAFFGGVSGGWLLGSYGSAVALSVAAVVSLLWGGVLKWLSAGVFPTGQTR